MKIYIRFLTYTFFKSFFFVVGVMLSLIFILNLISELEFFREKNVDANIALFLAFLNSPTMIFEIFPFIFFDNYPIIFYKII